MADLDQKRRTVRVLELLSESFEALKRGDAAGMARLIDQAVEVDAFAVSGIQGGIIIGEIPNPERDRPLWAEYVQVNRDGLAAMEAEEAGGGDFLADRHVDLDAGEFGGAMTDVGYHDRTEGGSQT